MRIQVQHRKLPITFVLDRASKAVAFKYTERGCFIDADEGAVWNKDGLYLGDVLYAHSVLHTLENPELKKYLSKMVDESAAARFN